MLLLVVLSIALWIPAIKTADENVMPEDVHDYKNNSEEDYYEPPPRPKTYDVISKATTSSPANEAACQPPTAPQYGSVEIVGGRGKVDSIAVYKCVGDRIMVGSATSKCLSTGQWTFDAPKCFSRCTVPYIPRGKLGKYEIRLMKRNRKYIEREVFVPSRTGLKVNPGHELFLQCDRGYIIGGTLKVNDAVICEDGSWSQNQKCVSGTCSEDPPTITNGHAVVFNRGHESTVSYKCDEHYFLRGESTVQCWHGEWIGDTPTCTDIHCYVDKLDYPGLVKTDQKIYNFGSSFAVVCENGYELAMPGARFTCSVGQWRGLRPPCVAANNETLRKEEGSIGQNVPFMKPISEPDDVIGKTTKNSLPAPSVRGDEEQKFQKIPQVSEERVEIIDHYTCFCTYENSDSEVVAFHDGHVLKYGDRVKMGSKVKFHCQQLGYRQIYGPREILCRTCKTWVENDFPICLNPGPGDTLIILDETKVQILPGGIVGIQVGDTVEFSCYGSEKYGIPKWYYHGPAIPSRISLARDHAKGYTNASMRISRVAPEHEGTYKCGIPSKRGHLMRVRILGIACPDLGDIKGMGISYSDGQRVGSKARFRCRLPGVLSGPSQIQCEKNGTWSRSLPSCKLSNCTLETLFEVLPENVVPVVQDVIGDAIPYDSSMSLTCDDNLTLIGNAAAKCGGLGRWEVGNPQCILGCTPFVKPPSSEVMIEPQKKFYRVGESVRFSCPLGFTLIPNVQRAMCLGSGWSYEDIPDCE